MSRSLQTILLTLIIVLTAWLPRVVGLDAFVTPDEPRWLTRSANFYQALSTQNWAQTYQREHPGVTVMWAGTFAWLTHLPDYPQKTPGPFHPDETTLESWLKTNMDTTALQMLVTARWWMVTWISLLLGVSFLLLRRLTGTLFAFIALLWVALEPFYIALSRLLHLDALLATLLLTSLLALLVYLEKGAKKRWLLLSGLLLGLAGLTKVPALSLAIFGTGLILWYHSHKYTQRKWQRKLFAIMLWGSTALVTVVVLFPALWVAPVETLTNMAKVVSYYAEEGHGDGVFFLGSSSPSPGWLFYPVVLLFRATPATFVGSVLVIPFLFWSRRNAALAQERRLITILLLFALFFALFISLSAKQQERYLIPLFPFLGIGAAWSLSQVCIRYRDNTQPVRWRPVQFFSLKQIAPVTLLVVVVLVALQLVYTVGTYPYYFTFYNPLVGGNRTAPRILTVGSGEGLKEAAEWVETQNRNSNAHVLSWYDNGPLSYYLSEVEARPLSENWSPTAWCGVKYVITYINQWQRHLPNEAAHQYFTTLNPTYTVRLSGTDSAYVHIYDMTEQPLPDFSSTNDDAEADFGGLIRLTTVDMETTQVEPGQTVRVTLNLQSLAAIVTDYNLLLKLLAPDGSEVWREEGYPWGAPTSDWKLCDLRPDGHDVEIPLSALPGDYVLTAEFYDPATFAPLTITEANRSMPLGESAHPVATIMVLP